jgi:type IV pilus assembly protein PilA
MFLKLEIKAKLLQYLLNHKNDEGITLVELLVVIVIIVILGFIATPSYLPCANKGKQAEVRTYIGSLNRGQQVYWIKHNTFSPSIDQLGVGVKTQTENYQYSILTTKKAAFSYGVSRKGTFDTKSYVGAVFVVPETPVKQVNTKVAKQKIEMTTVAIVCVANELGTSRPAYPIYQNDKATCGDKTYDPLNPN